MNLYDNMLDIAKFKINYKYSEDIEYVTSVIEKYMEELKEADVTGYCMQIQNELVKKIKSKNFDCMLFNTSVISPGELYSHYFSVLTIKNSRYLLDPTFKQFFDKTKFTKVNGSLNEYEFTLDLLEKGMIELNPLIINNYLNSFYKEKENNYDFTIEEIIPRQIK